MIIDKTEQITNITVAENTYIFDKINMMFTLIDKSYGVAAYQLENKKDFKEFYTSMFEETYEELELKMPYELKEWFENTYNDITD